jgi:hypothetical protein
MPLPPELVPPAPPPEPVPAPEPAPPAPAPVGETDPEVLPPVAIEQPLPPAPGTDTAEAPMPPAPAPQEIDGVAETVFDPASPPNVPEPIFVTASLEPFNTLNGSKPAPVTSAPVLESNAPVRTDGAPPPGSPVLESIDAGFPAVRDKVNGVQAPTLTPLTPIPDIAANAGGLSFSVPHDAFIHTDGNAVVTLEARQVGGAALPNWLSFDGVSGLLNGSLKAGDAMPTLQLEIIARDNARREARTTFTVSGIDRPDLASTDAGFPAVRLTFDQLEIAPAMRGSDMLVRFRPVPDQQVEFGRLAFSVPADAFAHTNPRATIRLEARLASGEPLPSWIAFNGVTGRLTGTAPEGFDGVLRIHVTARDQQGLQASTEFTIEVRSLAAKARPAGDKQSGAEEPAPPQRPDQGEADGEQKDITAADQPREEKAQRAKAKRGAAAFADQLKAVREVRTGAIDATLLDRALASKASKRPAQAAPKS